MDSKASGLSNQLMQYNSQIHECHATHQTRYGSPGIFPVVHLFKKNIPIRSITPNTVTSYMAIQESSPYYGMEYTNTVEDITNDNDEIGYDNQETNISTPNVLDALQEISRKRIHSENQGLQPHYSKRQKSECCAEATATSSNVANSTVHVTEVPPVINAITASLSSARTYMIHPRKSIKRTIQYEEAEEKEQKHAETQTDNLLQDKSSKPSLNISVSISEDKSTENSTVYTKSPSSVVITHLFDESQFEIAKKNKLAILLSPLTGTKAKLLPYKHELVKTDTNANKLLSSQIKPASILSPKNKPKHNKHVTFAIPEIEDVKHISKSDNNSDTNPIPNFDKNKADCDIHLHSTETPQMFNKEEKEADNHPITESNSFKEGSTYSTTSTISENQLFQNTPSSAYSSTQILFNNEPKTPSIVTDKFTNNGSATETPSTVSLMPPSIIPTSMKVGGFKFDFKNSETVQGKLNASLTPSLSDTSAKSRLSGTNFNIATNSDSQTGSSSLTNMPMFSSNFSAPSVGGLGSNLNSQIVNASSTIQNLNTSSYNSATNAKRSLSSSPFGANTTVTSVVGTSMLFSTGLGTSAVLTTTPLPISSPTCNVSVNTASSLSPPMLNFNANQTPAFGANLGISTIKSSVPPTNSNLSSTGFGVPDFLNAASKGGFSFTTNSTTGFSAPTTNFCANTNNNNAGAGLTSASGFGVTPLINNKSDESLTTTSATGFNLGSSFSPSIFASGQFKQDANNPATGFGDNKVAFTESIVKPNVLGTVINNESNIFGSVKNNSNVCNFTGFQATSPQRNSLFTSGSAIPPQSETFSISTSNTAPLANTNIFAFGGQNNVPNTISSLFSSVPNSAFNSITTSTFGSSTNPFGISTNTGFNTATYNNVGNPKFDSTTSRIFSIGSGTSYPKSRTQLKGRRRT